MKFYTQITPTTISTSNSWMNTGSLKRDRKMPGFRMKEVFDRTIDRGNHMSTGEPVSRPPQSLGERLVAAWLLSYIVNFNIVRLRTYRRERKARGIKGPCDRGLWCFSPRPWLEPSAGLASLPREKTSRPPGYVNKEESLRRPPQWQTYRHINTRCS